MRFYLAAQKILIFPLIVVMTKEPTLLQRMNIKGAGNNSYY
jgi:hypothetical protein